MLDEESAMATRLNPGQTGNHVPIAELALRAAANSGPADELELRGRGADQTTDDMLLAAMTTIRAVEEKIRELRSSGEIVGSVHLSIGQEAIPVGALTAMLRDDPVFATYRGHGWALASGSSIEAMFAELLGREGGMNGGRGGSAYLSDADHAFYGENSIVGAGAPIACGAALAATYNGSGQVSLTVFGDGAVNQGSVSEAFNFAAAMKLPIVFICENNRYSELTLIADVVNNDRLFERGAPYGMPSVRIDGNDARAVAAAVGEAAARARDGGGPSLIEAMTERLVGHYIGDAEQYRVAGELDRLLADEPIARLRRTMVTSAERAQSIVESVHQAVSDAAERALAQPLADVSQVRHHLYVMGDADA
jgi:TPP-dependent pyruvate/acetoin dehydrogenase alpha subunit